MSTDRIKIILDYWLGEERKHNSFPTNKAKLWFQGGLEVDQEIRSLFSADLARAARGDFNDWTDSPAGHLALIILLDQFSRNIFRGTPGAFQQDPQALQLAIDGVSAGIDKKLVPVERYFFYLPFEHAEDLELQRKSVALYTQLAEEVPPEIEFPMRNALDYAVKHLKIIEEFGRFPHRNAILGRGTTPEEESFLKQPDSSF